MVKYSAFCLSLMSPFFHKTLCGPFKEATERQMVLQEDERAVRKVMELACGCKGGVCVRDVEEMVVLGAVADQYGMEAVVSAVEDHGHMAEKRGGGRWGHCSTRARRERPARPVEDPPPPPICFGVAPLPGEEGAEKERGGDGAAQMRARPPDPMFDRAWSNKGSHARLRVEDGGGGAHDGAHSPNRHAQAVERLFERPHLRRRRAARQRGQTRGRSTARPLRP